VVTPEDLKSAFKSIPDKTVSSFSGRGVHHYMACAEGSDDGLADIQVEFHASIVMVPLDAGFFPERWKQAVDVMLEKCRGSQDRKSYDSYNSLKQISIKFSGWPLRET
jgi:hypothetical protein